MIQLLLKSLVAVGTPSNPCRSHGGRIQIKTIGDKLLRSIHSECLSIILIGLGFSLIIICFGCSIETMAAAAGGSSNTTNGEAGDDAEVLEVIDIRNIQSYLSFDESFADEIIFDMSSLGSYMLLGHSMKRTDGVAPIDYAEEDHKLKRLSLAYEGMHFMPRLVVQELAKDIKILDISHNEFKELSFLSEFKQLSTLICDHNNITSKTVIPYMPKLEILWMNRCKIVSLYPWAQHLQMMCPNLKHLSLMGNPIAPSYLNGGNFYEYLQYRLFVISLFPKLVYLDDRPVNEEQRKEAQRIYRRPLMERVIMKTQVQVPFYLRSFSNQVSNVLAPTPTFGTPEKNVVI